MDGQTGLKDGTLTLTAAIMMPMVTVTTMTMTVSTAPHDLNNCHNHDWSACFSRIS